MKLFTLILATIIWAIAMIWMGFNPNNIRSWAVLAATVIYAIAFKFYAEDD